MSRRTMLKELPGWAEAVEELKTLEWGPNKAKMLSHSGDYLRVIGAFAVPPSITAVSTPLLKAMMVGLKRHVLHGSDVEELAAPPPKVIVLKEWRAQRRIRACKERRVRGDWSDHWTGRTGFGDPEL